MLQPPNEGESPPEPLPRHLLESIPELLPGIDHHLTQTDVDEFHQILKEEYGVTYSDKDAWEAARNLLRFSAVLLDCTIRQERERAGLPPRPEVPRMSPPEPRPPPKPIAFPIPLEADHAYEVRSNLLLLEHELSRVKAYPTSWRWAIVAMYNALGHSACSGPI